MVLRRLNRNSEPQATIESGAYTLQYVHISIHLSGSKELGTTGEDTPEKGLKETYHYMASQLLRHIEVNAPRSLCLSSIPIRHDFLQAPYTQPSVTATFRYFCTANIYL
jgi:hypothetical protein